MTRTNAIYFSPRIEKYIFFFELNNIDYLIVGWDRLNQNLLRKNTIYFRQSSGYNVGGLSASINRFRWIFFLFKVLLKNKKKITTIHAFDLDTAFPATLFKVLFNKKVKVIFDVCDWMSATLYNQSKFILFVFKLMEAFTIRHSDEVVICEPERIEQIPYKLSKKELVIPNIPTFTETSFLFVDDRYKFNNDRISLSYVGGFTSSRNLDELLKSAMSQEFNLLIAGYGSKEIEDKCKELSILSNIKYFGKVDYKIGLNIMYNSNIIYAMYSKSNPNHFYAAPNKYYEAMMLGKPIISTKGINMERKILDNNIGYIIEESSEELINLINSLSLDDIQEKGKAANLLWENKYKNYTSKFLNEEYIDLIKVC